MDLGASVLTIRAAVGGLETLYCFGSQVSGEARSSSDVDIAFLAQQPVSPELRWKLQEEVAAQLGKDVDLVDLRTASTVLRAQIVNGGKVLYEVDPSATALFEATALAAYARLNEERSGILADIRERGSVHG